MMEQAGAPVNSRRSGRSRSQEPRRVRSPGSLGVPRPRYSRRRCAPGSPSAPRSVPPRDAGSKSGTGPYPACAARGAPARADDNITVGANPDRSAGPYGSRGAPPRCCCVPATSGYATRRRRNTRRITQKGPVEVQRRRFPVARAVPGTVPRYGRGQAPVSPARGFERSARPWHTRLRHG